MLNIIGLITGSIGTAFSFLLAHSLLCYAFENAKEFYFNRKRLKRFLCDVTAIGGALVTFLACTQLMAMSLMGLLG